MNPALQRAVGIAVLVATGTLSLPVVAYFLDGPDTENWIVPVQLLCAALIGAAVSVALPALSRAGAGSAQRALTGVGWGLLAAGAGIVVFWLLLMPA